MSAPAGTWRPESEVFSQAPLDMVVVGGCGHVGLPLALCFADAGCSVGIYDIDEAKIDLVRSGRMPFLERGAEELLQRLLPSGRLQFSSEPEIVTRGEVVVLVIGTPIDEFMNPSVRLFDRVVEELSPRLRPGALLLLRSTVYPGTTEYVRDRLRSSGVEVDVVFCPERIVEGEALSEMRSLPQLVGASDDRGFQRAAAVFERLGVQVIRLTPPEAELAKLLNNTWRYLKFAIANQFFQIAHQAGIDYNNVLRAVRQDYPRGADLPGPGFAAGPCLLKDTMQLAAFSPDHFPMGHAAMLVNEGLPGYIVETIDRRRGLRGTTLGILGMAFKGESDDTRTSLSYKLRKLAAFRGARVLCSDPYVNDPDLVPLETVLAEADVLVVAAPHRCYRELQLDANLEVVDLWGVTGRGIVL